jgi:hypothetical protein
MNQHRTVCLQPPGQPGLVRSYLMHMIGCGDDAVRADRLIGSLVHITHLMVLCPAAAAGLMWRMWRGGPCPTVSYCCIIASTISQVTKICGGGMSSPIPYYKFQFTHTDWSDEKL